MTLLEVESTEASAQLTEADQAWLANFGVDPSWQTEPKVRDELNQLMSLGSKHLSPAGDEQWQEVVDARERFMKFAGMEEATIEKLRASRPTLIPPDTLVGAQRTHHTLGLDAKRMVKAAPLLTLNCTPDAINTRFDYLISLGLNATKVINGEPSALGFSSQAIADKLK
jgi:hypothetical protein